MHNSVSESSLSFIQTSGSHFRTPIFGRLNLSTFVQRSRSCFYSTITQRKTWTNKRPTWTSPSINDNPNRGKPFTRNKNQFRCQFSGSKSRDLNTEAGIKGHEIFPRQSKHFNLIMKPWEDQACHIILLVLSWDTMNTVSASIFEALLTPTRFKGWPEKEIQTFVSSRLFRVREKASTLWKCEERLASNRRLTLTQCSYLTRNRHLAFKCQRQ